MTRSAKEIQAFTRLLQARRLKLTTERRTLLDEVLQTRRHFDSDSLYEKLRCKGVRVSRDTVFRTMPLLLECGVVQKSVGDGRCEYFERTSIKGHHDHMVCNLCGKVIEFSSEKIERLQEALCAEHGFRMLFHDHRLYGHCRECDRK